MSRRVKKTDLNKGWMKSRQESARKIRPERHLIISEGTATEPQYFGAIRDIINNRYGERIQIEVHGAGKNTISLFNKALNIVKSSADTYRHVWIVYDRDDLQISLMKLKLFAVSTAMEKLSIMPHGQINV